MNVLHSTSIQMEIEELQELILFQSAPPSIPLGCVPTMPIGYDVNGAPIFDTSRPVLTCPKGSGPPKTVGGTIKF